MGWFDQDSGYQGGIVIMSKTLRSYLYAPASRPERYVKALSTGADAVIFDLEDAVAASEKTAARASLLKGLCEAKQAVGGPLPEILVRINCYASQWYSDDLDACARLDIDGIVVPKPDSPMLVARVANQHPNWRLYLLMETAAGFAHIEDLARAPNVARLMFGSVDLMLDLGIADDDAPLHYYRSLIVLHSRLANLPAPVDGVCTALDDDAALLVELKRAKNFGFQSKLCVHPRQVSGIHTGFAPSADEIAWARRICDEAGAGAAVAVNGKLVDAPILEQARRVLMAGS